MIHAGTYQKLLLTPISSSSLTTHYFPRDMVFLLRCNVDDGELTIMEEPQGDSRGILNAVLRCTVCKAGFRIEDGIARMLPLQLSREATHEMSIRNSIDYDCSNPKPFVPPAEGWRSALSDRLEVPAHLEALHASPSHLVLELACGDGRFTSLIAKTGARVLAVDFSINALRLLALRLPPGAKVGRVQADINQLHLASRAFDRALSFTPLYSRHERMNMFRTIAQSLKNDGRYVASFEHDDLNRRLLGLPQVRRYSMNGILIEHLTTKSLLLESAPFFSNTRIRPIRPRVPLVAKLPPSFAGPILLLAAVLPFVRHFGELLLLTAQRPVRLPVEGERRPGSRLAKGVYLYYMRRKGKNASWGEETI
jgi:SAM-dependent methyltransferase